MWTRIVILPFGNILGVLLIMLLFAPMVIPTLFGADPMLQSPVYITFLSAATILAVDAFVRSRSLQPVRWKKWLSPYEGGCFFLIPSWFFGAVLVICSILGLFFHAAR